MFAMTLQVIGLKRFGSAHDDHARREYLLAVEGRELAPVLAFLFVGHLFEREFGEGVAAHDFCPAFAVEDHKVFFIFSGGIAELVRALDLLRRSGLPLVVHGGDLDSRTDVSVLLEQRQERGVKQVFLVVVERYLDLIGQRFEHTDGAGRKRHLGLGIQEKPPEVLSAEVIDHDHDRQHDDRAYQHVQPDAPLAARRKAGLRFGRHFISTDGFRRPATSGTGKKL